MSDNKGENKNPENFWTTLPGILTALGTLLSAIVGLIGVIHTIQTSSKNPATSTPNQTSPPASQSSETTSSKSPTTLEVQANDRDGEPYFNNQDKSAKIYHFKAEGSWRVISPSNPDQWVKDCKVSTELISPNGLSKLTEECQPKDLPCPNYKMGALVVVEQNKDNDVVKCLASGADSNFEMEKGQRVFFRMNDNDYKDNEGKVTVKID